MWEHMKELAEEQSDENSRRKLSQDSSQEKVEEALPRVKEKRYFILVQVAFVRIIYNKILDIGRRLRDK